MRSAVPTARGVSWRNRPVAATGIAALGLLVVSACSASGQQAAGSGQARTLTVFAAASLSGTFTELAAMYEAEHDGVDVVLNPGASSALAQQIVAGSPAQVFAAASPSTVAVVVDAGLATGPRVFARNRLQIVTPPDNPGAVTGLSDFARDELTLALCAAQVPCGAAAGQVLAAAGVVARPDTLEQDVKAVLSKVLLGEVDAGLVYRTDVLAVADRVLGIAFPEADDAVSDYPVVTLSDSPDARDFVQLLLSREGQAVLARAGFDPV